MPASLEGKLVVAISSRALFDLVSRSMLDALGATTAGVLEIERDGSAVLVLAFESADHPLDAWMKRALEYCADHGGRIPDPEAAARDARDR